VTELDINLGWYLNNKVKCAASVIKVIIAKWLVNNSRGSEC